MAFDSQGRVIVSGIYGGSMQLDDRLLMTAVPEDANTSDAFLASFAAPSLTDTTTPTIGAATDQAGLPVLTVPKDIFAQATSAAGATVFFMPPTAIDTGNAGTSVYCSPPPNTTFPVGQTTVVCAASDPLGNKSSAAFTVTVVDARGPVFSPVADVTRQTTSASGATVTYPAPTATDQVDGAIAGQAVACTPASGSSFAIGKTTVTCTASDHSNNQSLVTFSVNVACTPTTCAARGASCGTIADGCGGTLTCGASGGQCPSGLECSQANTCGSPTFAQLKSQYPAHTVQGNQTCSGTPWAPDTTINGNLTIAAGQQCTLYGVMVSGNVQVGSNATFNAESSVINGNLSAQGSASLTVLTPGRWSRATMQTTGVSGVGIAGSISGNVSIVQTGSALPGGNWICGAIIGGNLQVTQGAAGASFDIGGPPSCAAGNTIRGNAQIVQNRATVTVDRNVISGSLQCSQNGAVVDTGNTVAGGAQGQCATSGH